MPVFFMVERPFSWRSHFCSKTFLAATFYVLLMDKMTPSCPTQNFPLGQQVGPDSLIASGRKLSLNWTSDPKSWMRDGQIRCELVFMKRTFGRYQFTAVNGMTHAAPLFNSVSPSLVALTD